MFDARESIPRNVVRLAGPAIAQQLLNTLVFLTDRAMLGHYSDDALASMQISGPVTWCAASVLGAFTAGTLAVVGRAVGAGDRAGAAAAARASIGLSAVLGIFSILTTPLIIYGATSLFPDAGTSVRALSASYLRWILPCLLFHFLVGSAASSLQAAGNTKTPMLAGAAANLIKITLNYMLIFGHCGAPELGVQGAALSSAIAIGGEAAVLFAVLARSSSPVTIRGGGGERSALRRLVRISIPTVLEKAVQQSGFIGFVTLLGTLGTTAMAANQALISLESICFLTADGIGLAGAAIVAQRLGAGDPQAARRGARIATLIAVGLLSFFGLAFLTIPGVLIRGFSDDVAIVNAALPCFVVAAVAQPLMATGVVLSESLRGAGATRAVLVIMVAGGLVTRLVATALLVPVFGLVGVWLGSTIDWLVRTILLLVVFRDRRWETTRM